MSTHWDASQKRKKEIHVELQSLKLAYSQAFTEQDINTPSSQTRYETTALQVFITRWRNCIIRSTYE